jgi:phenylacetate-CoA ligase
VLDVSGLAVQTGVVYKLTIGSQTYSYTALSSDSTLSAILTGSSPCGRSNQRLKGWMGRADQTTKIRAMFVHPSQVADILKRHPQILKGRLVVTGEMGNDQMTLHCEVADLNSASNDAETIIASIREVTKLRGEVKLVAAGSLPNDGKVIEDARSYK